MLAAAAPALWMRDFTVDDALVSIRYARHVAAGAGYRFNVPGPITDGVTPLPWALLVAPFAHDGAEATLLRVKYISLAAWLVAAAALGAAIGRARAPTAAKACALAILAACVPVAAHAVSGMETGLVIALATAATLAWRRPFACAALAGLTASLRPEMAPWALVFAVAVAWPRPGRANVAALAGAASLVPFAACALIRVAVFGRPAPLSILAKPSDLAHGLVYAAAASIAALAPILVVAPRALARAPAPALAIVLAGAAHVAAVMVAGGDWMPYARLVAPIVPSLLYAFVLASPHASRIATSARVAVATAAGAFMWLRAAPAGRHVGEDRAALIARARPLLAASRGVASIDVGWVSAATEATIVDLAGLTDPAIAVLPGGHTSKRVDPSMLLSYAPEHLLLYVDGGTHDPSRWREGRFVRTLEARLADSDLIARHYDAIAYLPLHGEAGYFLLRETR